MDDTLYRHIMGQFPFSPTANQESAIQRLCRFLVDTDPRTVFLLKGYAGTGKSSLTGALVKGMDALARKAVLMAPTGRAAKVFAACSEHPASTIHRKIYRQKTFSAQPDDFLLATNLHKNTLFFVDEASMISNSSADSLPFGTGCLLDDLIHYVYSGQNCRLILLGDTAQLPPVSRSESPALSPAVLEGYGLTVTEMTLTQVVRQAQMSGILLNATRLRKTIDEDKTRHFPQITFGNGVFAIRGDELTDAIDSAYSRDGREETIVITRSNRNANIYNNGIRSRILFREEEIASGDLLMAVKNNYFHTAEQQDVDFIANGDIIEVRRVRKTQEIYGFRFCDITAALPDYGLETDIKILLDTLHTDTPALPADRNDLLFRNVLADYANEREKMKKVKSDPYYNAVQVKYAAAITCHKAQGGQWKNVFLDIGYITEQHLGLDFYRWLYTAFTRATEKIYLVNLPKEFIDRRQL
jgi:exodeoxyribonuclease-5